METGSNKKRILVIEDEPIISRISVRVLTAAGFEVDIANNGLVAKEMAGKGEYDLYLSDIRTPSMNGMEFYEYLRQMYPGLESRVIFTTGDSMSHEVKAFLDNKKNLLLSKPFTPGELRASINKALKAIAMETEEQ
jgi:CheY-like chemotaxis protein